MTIATSNSDSLIFLDPLKDLKNQLTERDEKITRLEFLLKKTREQLDLAHLETESKNQRAEIAEIYLENVVRNINEHVYWMDKDGVMLGCNEQQAKSFKLKDPKELIGKNIYDVLYGLKWAANIIEAIRKNNVDVMRTKKTIIKEEIAFYNDEEHTFISYKHPLLNKQGEVIGIFGASTDLDEKLNAEKAALEAKSQAEIERIEYEFKKRGIHYNTMQAALEEAKQKAETAELYLMNFVKHAPGHFYWIDKKGMLLGCNDRQAQNFGFEKAAYFIGKNIYDLLYGINWDSKLVEALRINNISVMNSGTLQVTEETGTFDGEEKIFLSYKCPLLNKEENSVIGIFGFSVDITDRKKAEMELLLAKEEAERAFKIKTEFIENMRHDLRTPFSGIIGIAQILESQEADLDKKDSLGWIVKSSTLVLNILNDILAGANTGMLKKSNEYSLFSMKEITANISDLLAAEIHLKKLKFDVQIDSVIPDLLAGDKIRLQHVLLNLLSNAVKFTEHGGVELHIKSQDIQKEHINLIFVVKDTGIGIPKNKLNFIFEKFVKLRPSFLSNKYVGVGVGLSIVQNLIQEMKGTIEVESKEEEGTTFTFMLPFDYPDSF